MKKFVIRFTSDIELYYNLVEHEISDHWSTLITERTVDDLCKINHYAGCHNTTLLESRINRLYELIDIINPHTPNKIDKVRFSENNYQDALNKMHVHFPELENDNNYVFLRKYLSEYNDIIHWLEPTIADHYTNNTTNSKFSIKLDFNKVQPLLPKYVIPESAYKLFNGCFTFGQLMLHYVHVGRHAWELFYAKDLICPKEQYLPQSEYNATVRLHFYNNSLDNIINRYKFLQSWHKFYVDRGGKDFFDCEVQDPKIRFGYCQIGMLSSIIENQTIIPLPKTIEEIISFRNKLVTTSVIGWDII